MEYNELFGRFKLKIINNTLNTNCISLSVKIKKKIEWGKKKQDPTVCCLKTYKNTNRLNIKV